MRRDFIKLALSASRCHSLIKTAGAQRILKKLMALAKRDPDQAAVLFNKLGPDVLANKRVLPYLARSDHRVAGTLGYSLAAESKHGDKILQILTSGELATAKAMRVKSKLILKSSFKPDSDVLYKGQKNLSRKALMPGTQSFTPHPNVASDYASGVVGAPNFNIIKPSSPTVIEINRKYLPQHKLQMHGGTGEEILGAPARHNALVSKKTYEALLPVDLKDLPNKAKKYYSVEDVGKHYKLTQVTPEYKQGKRLRETQDFLKHRSKSIPDVPKSGWEAAVARRKRLLLGKA